MHWDGDQLVFTTNSHQQLDDIKVGTSADITFGSGYTGITFWDRGPGGVVLYCHNASGTGGSGQVSALPGLQNWGASPCYSASNSPSFQYPENIEWFAGPLQAPCCEGQPRVGGVGQGALVGMYRPDGISDGANTIQGVRTTSSSSGTWTTPDAFAGVVNDPATQKSYIWNGNNPIAFQDSTGEVPTLQDAYNAIEGNVTYNGLLQIAYVCVTPSGPCPVASPQEAQGQLSALGNAPGLWMGAAFGMIGGVFGGAAEKAAPQAVRVIGRLADTQEFIGRSGYSVLQSPGWTLRINDEWVQEGIAKHEVFYVASPLKNNLVRVNDGAPTVFARELQQLLSAGYKWNGPFLVPP